MRVGARLDDRVRYGRRVGQGVDEGVHVGVAGQGEGVAPAEDVVGELEVRLGAAGLGVAEDGDGGWFGEGDAVGGGFVGYGEGTGYGVGVVPVVVEGGEGAVGCVSGLVGWLVGLVGGGREGGLHGGCLPFVDLEVGDFLDSSSGRVRYGGGESCGDLGPDGAGLCCGEDGVDDGDDRVGREGVCFRSVDGCPGVLLCVHIGRAGVGWADGVGSQRQLVCENVPGGSRASRLG